jgi:hypothetical protein
MPSAPAWGRDGGHRPQAIVAAVARIAETDPWLGRHLRDHIHTGWECRYESDPDHPIRWLLS